MSDSRLQDLPKIKKMKEKVEQIRSMKALLPLMKVMGQDTTEIEKAIAEVEIQARTFIENAEMMDEFNDFFATRGWITYDLLDLDVMRTTVQKAKNDDLAGAEADLVAYYSPDKVDQFLILMIGVKPFRPRMELAKKAARDYREGRYYASTMLILALMDGLVSEISENRRGISAEDVNLQAWDSIAGHTKGLSVLVGMFKTGRRTVRTEHISLPYRHGIMHGMDLGFDNQMVAAKTWAALFAVREWAIKVAKGELYAPPEEPEPTLAENIQSIQRTATDLAKMHAWTTRGFILGQDIPKTGEPQEYGNGTPERILVEFLAFWLQKNYGKMSTYLSFMDKRYHGNKLPRRVREHFEQRLLKSHELVEIIADTASIAIFKARIVYEYRNFTDEHEIDFILQSEDPAGKSSFRWKLDQRWVIVQPYV